MGPLNVDRRGRGGGLSTVRDLRSGDRLDVSHRNLEDLSSNDV